MYLLFLELVTSLVPFDLIFLIFYMKKLVWQIANKLYSKKLLNKICSNVINILETSNEQTKNSTYNPKLPKTMVERKSYIYITVCVHICHFYFTVAGAFKVLLIVVVLFQLVRKSYKPRYKRTNRRNCFTVLPNWGLYEKETIHFKPSTSTRSICSPQASVTKP